MKRSPIFTLIVAASCAFGSRVWAQPIDASFVYQGQLKRGELPVNGACDFEFRLFTAVTDGTQIGSTLLHPVVPVEKGLFTVALNFGASAFNGDQRFLQITVECAGDGAQTVLSPRHAMAASPYAAKALSTVGVDGHSLDALDGSPTDAVRVDANGKVFMDKGGLDILGGLDVFDDAGHGITLTSDSFSFNEGTSEDPVYGYSSTTDRHSFYTSGTRQVVIDDTGNVGIGIPWNQSPAAKLQIGGVSGSDGIMFPDGTMQLTAATPGSGSSLWSESGDHIYYNTGRVGIGTSAPGSMLSLKGPNDAVEGAILRLEASFPDSVESGRIRFGENTGNLRGGFIHYDGFTNDLYLGTHAVANSDPADDVNMITLERNDGQVGIHTESPQQPFHVVGPSRMDGRVGIGAAPDVEASLRADANSTLYGIKAQTALSSYAAVAAIATSSSGSARGIIATSSAPDGYGVEALGKVAGVLGSCTQSGGAGVKGTSSSTSGYGGQFMNTSTDGAALYAESAGAGKTDATLQVHNTQVNAGMAAYMTSIGSYATAHVQNNGTGEVLWMSRDNSDGEFIVAYNEDTGGRVFSVAPDGWTKVSVLEITGGADLSEQFDVASEGKKVEPGMVVVIDADHPGKLAVSTTAYDRKVAGVVSGAGGVKPGMLMGQTNTLADGEHPVALTGRVWTWCDASTGAIEPGDLLTASGTAGHAMKVSDYGRAQGAVIGKAMTELKDGKGLVLVLVQPQ